MSESASRLRHIAVREGAIVGLAAAGSLLFAVHQSFYSGSGVRFLDQPPWVFALLTAVLYLFLRMMFLVGGMFYPRKRPEFILCPECGRVLDDASPKGVDEHNRIAITPRPTEREILAAVMLRKAIDEARRSAKRDLAGPGMSVPNLPGDVENAPISLAEFDRILRDLDRSRDGAGEHRPRAPREPPRGPSP